MAEITEIYQNTWRMEESGVYTHILCGTEKALLIDTGMNMPNAKEMAEGVVTLPLELLNTHADGDHVSGNAAFERMYMSPAEEPVYRSAGRQGEIIPVKGGDIIDLGGRPLEIIDIPGHTPGSIAVLDVQNRVLFSGDSVQDGNIFMFGTHRNLELLERSLTYLNTMKDRFDEIRPSHGTPVVGPELIGKLLEGLSEIREGKAQAEKVNMFGTEVSLYKFDYAGFLCDLK